MHIGFVYDRMELTIITSLFQYIDAIKRRFFNEV